MDVVYPALEVGGVTGLFATLPIDSFADTSLHLPLFFPHPRHVSPSINKNYKTPQLTPTTGTTGLLFGAVSGVLRSTTPTLFALASGIQWFTLGSTSVSYTHLTLPTICSV